MPIWPRRRQPLRVAPEVVVVELLRRGDLEAVHGDALRVDAAHHVPDRPVLPRRVERLEDDENAVGALRVEARLILGQHARSPPRAAPVPCFFESIPFLNAGSKSLASVTFEPGSTLNGSTNSAIRFSRMAICSSSAGRGRGAGFLAPTLTARPGSVAR